MPDATRLTELTTALDARRPRFGLAARVLVLTCAFVMLAEIAIYVPSIANFRNNWLRTRISAAYTAALVLEAAPRNAVPDALTRQLLESVGARIIVLKMGGTRRILGVTDMPVQIDETYDLREPGAMLSIMAAFRALSAPTGRVLNVVADAPMGGDFIEVTMDESPLKAAMRTYSVNVLLVSLAISIMVAVLAVIAINLMVLRPVRRLTSNLMDFGHNPEDTSRIIKPSGRNHEIGHAEEALSVMQGALVRELGQKKHLAALGLAVAKINHDLRNMLASSQLLSDRLADVPDPLAQRLAPKLVATLDRAIRFCQATLAYGRAVDEPPVLKTIHLRPIAVEAAETIGLATTRVEIRNDVPEDFQLNADSEQIFRVLMNLCRNSVEALEHAGPQPGRAALVHITAQRANGDAVIEISDTGPGVSAVARAGLFSAFQGSTRPGGSGLGLAIAADLVRAHGGSITLVEPQEDSPENGAVFRIVLPQRA